MTHAESIARRDRAADRRRPPDSLRDLLRWAHAAYLAETPDLDHSGTHLDDDGTPTMAGRVRAYLALTKRGDSRDDWVLIASATDDDGHYITPLRRAIATLPPERRLLARDIVPEVLSPLLVTRLHDIPDWCADDVLHRTLVMVWQRFTARPIPTAGKSDAQRDAEGAA